MPLMYTENGDVSECYTGCVGGVHIEMLQEKTMYVWTICLSENNFLTSTVGLLFYFGF